jgi:hypothetical protein
MARVKKAEREAVVSALMQEHETAEDAAEAAITALDELREQEMQKTANRPFAILMQGSGGPIYTFGPYATEAKATRALKDLVSPDPYPYHAAVFRLYAVKE